MYWYLSFLRPPPVTTPISSGSITITPQIANDLRTELLFEPTNVSYSWQRVAPSIGTIVAGSEDLLWNPPESTYKPVTLALPSTAKPGESWRVGLHIGPHRAVDVTHYTSAKPAIIGVWSECISLVRGESSTSGQVRTVGGSKGPKAKADEGRNKGKAGKGKDDEGKKQGRINREWRAGDGELRVVERTSFDLDKKIWDSGLGLSGWLWRYMDKTHRDVKANALLDEIKGSSDLNVLELGSGTGLVSIALGLALSRSKNAQERQINITATDLESAIELMDENLTLNGFDASSSVKVQAKVLDWELPIPSWVSPWPSVVIAADVTYNTASFPPLLSTLTSLLKPEDGARPTLLLAYKQRDAAERDLWGQLEAEGIKLEQVDTIQGSEEEGVVEIWLGRAQ